MIKSVHIENFKCFKNFDIELGPFNVLIGPNDSGKTGFLQTLSLFVHAWVAGKISSSEASSALGMPLGTEAFWRNNVHEAFKIVGVDVGHQKTQLEITVRSSGVATIVGTDQSNSVQPSPKETCRIPLRKEHGVCESYHLMPREIRIPSEVSKNKMEVSGRGFPTFLHGILNASWDVSLFARMKDEFRQRFGYDFRFDEAVLKKEGKYAIDFRGIHGETLSANSVSDGVMLSFAFMALSSRADPPGILLIEEPENGVHWASLQEIIRTLRELSQKKGVQVILTTHSPYLLDLVGPEEVRVFSKDEEGAVHAKKMSDYPEVEKLTKHFMTGEIWTGLVEQKPSDKEQVAK